MTSAHLSAAASLESGGRCFRIVDLPGFAGKRLARLPHVHRILLENALRAGSLDDAHAVLDWLAKARSDREISFHPGRVLMHDTTCVPALVDIAAMRSALAEAGHDPARLDPVLPVDVSVDHSIAVDVFGTPDAASRNMEREIARNAERYRLMKWAAAALGNLKVHPPGTGIMHTLNLERLASVIATKARDGADWAMPDTLIGTDSHTPMINGIGVLAWGVGGLEAESVLFGMPVMLRVPEILGVRLTGAMREGRLATDLALSVTERLRRIRLDGRFVEFFGPGLSTLAAGERAVIANMAPEYGAASGYFPIDSSTLRYLAMTGRPPELIRLIKDYARRQGLWHDPQAEPRYSETIDIDLAAVETSLAGPRRPQDRLSLAQAASGNSSGQAPRAVAIAAITSCTNTSEPRLLLAAGLLARKARRLGLRPPAHVKTSLAPGSPAAARYLERAGLMEDLAALGFGIVGYGCTTCIGNSGALTPQMQLAIAENAVEPVAVLSGNRNFPGRIHPQIEEAYLASPPLVVAYALAGTIGRDLACEPIATGAGGGPVHLADIWPGGAEIDAALAVAASPSDYDGAYCEAERNPAWQGLAAPQTSLFPWDENSTYIRRPPFATKGERSRLGHYAAHPLLVLGDDVTTDHISPAGQIAAGSAAARYLVAHGEDPRDLNVFAARRGNFEAMLRGLFTNKAVRNLLGPAIPAGSTIHADSGEIVQLSEAAERYAQAGQSVVVVAGERYGMGSSRDWAAKGQALLGVRAVLALSFERIHRQNLIGMGVLPLILPQGSGPETLRLLPGDLIEITAPIGHLRPGLCVDVSIRPRSGTSTSIVAKAAVETRLEIDLLEGGGMIPLILNRAGV